ncbi:MAG TPA: glycoside hydrolase family 27 protein [Gemmatimonadaceae bacterium]|nr:glycoside hydrolase family 27 protein [Gemmatimonadaceae bacterium]
MPGRLAVVAAAFLVGSLTFASHSSARARVPALPGNGLARTPPMGWNSWNHFACNVNEQTIRETADAMVATGMRDAGYRYVVIDDCWQVARDANGVLVADPQRFPHGIKALADYIHSKGLLFGIYTDAGTNTCQGRPGTLGHEDQDARTFAAWGVDYVKEDWCHAQNLDAPTQYAKFRDALARTGRPIVLSICEWGSNQPWEWAPRVGNLWRTTDDIEDTWSSMLDNLDQSAQHATAAGPGTWNDPDMLEVGNGGMTDEEYRAHFSLWAIMAAPLIAGNDLRQMSATTIATLTNREVIAVDQDSLGAQGILVWERPPELQVWAKPLHDGSRAIALLNRSSAPARITAYFSRAGLRSDSAQVRDLWSHQDVGRFGRQFETTVPSHGVVLVRATPVR